jgi:hypothetical protein
MEMVESSSLLRAAWVVVLLVVASALEVSGQQSPPFVKYCSLFEPTYEGKKVTSTALMFYSTVGRVDGDDTFLYSAGCNGPDYFAIPEGSSKAWGRWQAFLGKLPPEKELVLEITFEGKSEVETARLFGSLDGWVRARIIPSKVLSIRDITQTPNAVLANSDAPKPQVERIEHLQNIYRNFLQSLYAPSNAAQYVLDSLSYDFTFVDSNGKSFKKDDYHTLNAPWAGATSELSRLKETRTSYLLKSKTRDTMIWQGTLQLVFTTGAVKTYYCDLTTVLRGGSWTLRNARMVPGR